MREREYTKSRLKIQNQESEPGPEVPFYTSGLTSINLPIAKI